MSTGPFAAPKGTHHAGRSERKAGIPEGESGTPEDEAGTSGEDRSTPPLSIVLVGVLAGAGLAFGLSYAVLGPIFSPRPTAQASEPMTGPVESTSDLCARGPWVLEETRLLSQVFRGAEPNARTIKRSLHPGGVLHFGYASWVRKGWLPEGREQELAQLGSYYAKNGLTFGPATMTFARQALTSC